MTDCPVVTNIFASLMMGFLSFQLNFSYLWPARIFYFLIIIHIARLTFEKILNSIFQFSSSIIKIWIEIKIWLGVSTPWNASPFFSSVRRSPKCLKAKSAVLRKSVASIHVAMQVPVLPLPPFIFVNICQLSDISDFVLVTFSLTFFDVGAWRLG